PVITIEGGHFASRVSASILNAVGLPELVTGSVEEYAALAGELSRDPDRLRQLRGRLAENRLSEPLFDTPRFVKNLERAYERMWETFLEGGRPRRIEVTED
ncbi:MAG: glycosyltransferase, partial [Rhodospirillales bacterium]